MIKKYLSVSEIEQQEHLSLDRLQKLSSIKSKIASEDMMLRPQNSLLELMNWSINMFGPFLKEHNNIKKYLHNSISMDGQFLQFCEENSINITPLMHDCIVSWQTGDHEKFFCQGSFKVESSELEFIHNALMHKGNQNEDEISFFNLVDDCQFEKYVLFRNTYDKWVLDRDRTNQLIRVVEGQDVAYDRNTSWDDIFLPKETKTLIQNTVEGFLKSKDFYEKSKIPWKKGIILHGKAGCGKSSIIRSIISNYDFKPVTILPAPSPEGLAEAFAYAEEQSPGLLFIDDLDSMMEFINLKQFLDLLDGVVSKNGLLVIATVNNLKVLPESLRDRPLRFDRKIEIPAPNEEMAFKYLKKWFSKILTDKKLKEIAKDCVKNSFCYVHIKDLYISSMYNAIADGRDIITLEDINVAMTQVKKDNSLLKSKTIGIDKYMTK